MRLMTGLAVFWAMLRAGVAVAEVGNPVIAAAHSAFDRMPEMVIVDRIAGQCGANFDVNQSVAYCTSTNKIFLTDQAKAAPWAAYLIAHSLGHAVQVQHGIADVALAQIRARRAEEAALRGLVAQQVDCIAGFLYARAGLPVAALADWFTDEPFADVHWGRDPLRAGPVVSIGLVERDLWFQRGQAGDLADCAVGEFDAALLLRAFKG